MFVELETPNQSDVIALITELDAYQDTLYPAEARYALDLAALVKQNVLFAVARDGTGGAIGCGAVVLNEAYGEIKRMYVRPEAGQGVARQIYRTLESAAYAGATVCSCLKPASTRPMRWCSTPSKALCGAGRSENIRSIH